MEGIFFKEVVFKGVGKNMLKGAVSFDTNAFFDFYRNI